MNTFPPRGSSISSRPSRERDGRTFSLSTSTSMVLWGEMITERSMREWLQMGVSIMQSNWGSTMGPPAEREYAVEPVGVENMTPSPA
jgi:hypothetical protein